jgi:hypothetical protein
VTRTSGSLCRLLVREVCEGSFGLWRSRSHALQSSIDRGPSHAEELGQFGLGIGAEVVQLEQGPGLVGFSLGCLPRSRPFALATFMPSRVRIRMRSASSELSLEYSLLGFRFVRLAADQGGLPRPAGQGSPDPDTAAHLMKRLDDPHRRPQR